MYGTKKNKLGKLEKNKKVKEGKCIFPFKYKFKTHNSCVETPKGDICATSVNERGTLQTYGYCKAKTISKKDSSKIDSSKIDSSKRDSPDKKSSKKSTLKKPKKLILKTSSKKITLKKPKKKIILKKPSQDKIMSDKSSSIKKTSQEISSLKSQKSKVYNEELINVFGKLNEIMMAKGEPFRARAYKVAQETIMNITYEITTANQLKGKKGIGETILNKVKEYIETGKLQAIEKEKDNPIYIFTQVYGIGSKKAKELVEKNKITNIDQLRENKNLLNEKQKIGLKYYEDLLKKIPRSEIEDYERILKNIFNSVSNPKTSKMEIVGSYRRGKQESGDIDIIISDENNDKNIFESFINELINKNILIEILSRGKTKCLAISLINEGIPRRIDILYATPEEYAFSILYFTGSALFNTVMRSRAIQLGYTMNEHGLYKLVNKQKGNKLDLYFKTEKEIFDFLNLVFKEPNERINGNNVIVKKVENKEEIGIIDEPKVIKKPQSTILKNKTTLKKKLIISPSKNETLKISPPKKITSKKHTEKFIQEGIDYLYGLKETTLINMIKQANKDYYNNYPLLTDNQYDILKEYTQEKYPKNKLFKEIGAPVEKQKVKLPYFMGSMDKIKPDTNALDKWKQKYEGPYLISTKLDGVSALYSTENGEKKLYTRGNGIYGQDITYLIPYLKLPNNEDITIRGEIIISKEIFEKRFKDEASNPRNLVSGIINSKTSGKDKYKYLSFVAYEVIKPELKPSKQYDFMKTLDIEYALYENTADLTNNYLSEKLVAWRENYKYEIDGIVIYDDEIYIRPKDKNPEYAFAFKMVLSEQVLEAKVVDVLWTPSKHGLIKPRIRIEPVYIGGAKIEYATAFNAAYVRDNKIGIGALIQLIRSGDVIPHILSVITPAQEAKMPDVDYQWNETGIDIIIKDHKNNSVVREKNIVDFFVKIGVTGFSSGNVKRVINSGYDTVEKILSMNYEDFLSVEGFKEKMASKVYNSIKTQLEKIKLSKLMEATNLFGRGLGEKKFNIILNKYPNILLSEESKEEKINKINNLSGFAKKTAQLFIDNMPLFLEFIESTNLNYKLNISPKKSITPNLLSGKKIVMSGFRDKELQEKIEKRGGDNATSVSKNTFILLVKNKDEETGKITKAKQLNITIMTPEEFIEKYDL